MEPLESNNGQLDSQLGKRIREELVNAVRKGFGSNLVAVLFYGSSVRAGTSHDLDVAVVLKKKFADRVDDFLRFREIYAMFHYLDLDLVMLYSEEICPPYIYSQDHHGAYFARIMADAVVGFGENPFTNAEFNPTLVKVSLVNKIQNYVYRARQEFVGGQRSKKDSNPFYHRKKILRCIDDILLFDGEFRSHGDSLARFQELYPQVLSTGDMHYLLDSAEPPAIEQVLITYERLYQLMLVKARQDSDLRKKVLVAPERIRIGNIVAEYVAGTRSNAASIVLCEGLPSVPDRRELLGALASISSGVYYPRYRGTWESPGEFLASSPTDDIREVIEFLKAQRADTRFVLLGSSFGGAVALELASHPDVKAVIAASPVLSFKSVKGFETLESFLVNYHTGSYRFRTENWQRLARDEIICPKDNFKKPSNSSVSIFYGRQDLQIDSGEIEEFCKIHGLQAMPIQAGHLSTRFFTELLGVVEAATLFT